MNYQHSIDQLLKPNGPTTFTKVRQGNKQIQVVTTQPIQQRFGVIAENGEIPHQHT
jgi:hypothetical protein